MKKVVWADGRRSSKFASVGTSKQSRIPVSALNRSIPFRASKKGQADLLFRLACNPKTLVC